MISESGNSKLKIGIVGPCGAGKTSISQGLIDIGYNVRQIAQEHSYVKDMWKKISDPDILIFLEVSQSTIIRRKNFQFTKSDYSKQMERLSHAYQHADLVVNTDNKTVEDTLREILLFISEIHSS